MERPIPGILAREGGAWLGEARDSIKWIRCLGNGERVTWGSTDEIKPPLRVCDVEELASRVAATAMIEVRDRLKDGLREERMKASLRAANLRKEEPR